MLNSFHFKQFSISQENAAHPVGTDGVLLGAWADVSAAKKILDIGTGTGVVALMLAQRTAIQQPVITALEPNPAAFEQAMKNFSRSAWSTHIQAYPLTIQQFSINYPDKFDLLVSNPPFFTEKTMPPDDGRKMARHTDFLSSSDLLLAATRLLSAQGKFCVILPPAQAQHLCEKGTALGLYYTKITQVLSRIHSPVERVLLQFERNPLHLIKDTLVIYQDQQQYSDAYRSLTKDFYLNF